MDNNEGSFVERLANRWRADAHMIAAYGNHAVADVLLACASQLEAGQREYELEALTLDAAAEESGYSYSALQKKVACGELANVGEAGKPRIRRGDLPRKGTTGQTGLADAILTSRLR